MMMSILLNYIMTINSILKILVISILSILIIILGFLKIKFNNIVINSIITILIITIFIIILIDIIGIIIINKKKNNKELQNKLKNISIIIYNIIEKYNYHICEDIENPIEINCIKEDIDKLYNTYYKYYFYSNIINDIKIKLIIMKKKSLMKEIINEINIHKSISSEKDLQTFIKMKLNGLNTDLNIYKKYIKDFFISLNENKELYESLLYK